MRHLPHFAISFLAFAILTKNHRQTTKRNSISFRNGELFSQTVHQKDFRLILYHRLNETQCTTIPFLFQTSSIFRSTTENKHDTSRHACTNDIRRRAGGRPTETSCTRSEGSVRALGVAPVRVEKGDKHGTIFPGPTRSRVHNADKAHFSYEDRFVCFQYSRVLPET